MLSFLYKMQRLNLTPIAIEFVKVKPVNPLTIFQTYYCLLNGVISAVKNRDGRNSESRILKTLIAVSVFQETSEISSKKDESAIHCVLNQKNLMNVEIENMSSSYKLLSTNTVSQKRIALLTTLLCILILTFFVFNIPAFRSHDLSEYETIKKNCSGKQIVLFWTKFFETDDFYVGLGIKPFKKCKIFSCCSTNNRNFLDISDAIIFHIRDLDLNDMPPRRSVHQRWIFFLQESPLHTPNILYDLNNVFNWTMTFRIDSDIFSPYPVIETTPGSVLELQIWNTTFNSNKLKNNVRRKKKLVAWFVSNCITTSGREKYVSELKKYVDVDVYGACGTLTCSNHIECYKMLEREYKFYLAFENSICKDYVTEKFYNALLFNVVPVVYGGANYHLFAPKNSFVDVRDFASVHDLAEYLTFLDRNDSAYMRYFDWRKTPPGLSLLPRTNQGWCELCSMLNNNSLPSRSYSNIHSWWFEKGQCEKDRTSIKKLAI